ncbi:MAG: glutathione S-transferase family protein [Myxococcota bacterium]
MRLYIGDYELSSWSLRAWLALTESGLDFETIEILLDRPETAEALAQVSPTARVPVLHDGDLVIWESLAICEYVAERVPTLWPDDSAARAVARAVSAEMFSGFATLRREHPMAIGHERPRAPSPGAARDVARIRTLWNDCRTRFGALAGGPFLFGRFTIADAMYAPVVSRFRTYAIPTDTVCEAYADAVWEHPGMAAWRRLAADADDDETTRY